MGETCATLGNKRDIKVFNYKLINGEDIIWEPNQFK